MSSLPPSEAASLPPAGSGAPQASELGGRMPLFEHLRELRTRILRALIAVFIGFLLCYWQAQRIETALEAPLLELLRTMPQVTGKLMFTGMAEAFLVEVKVALAAGLLLASPVVFYQFWAFVSPGLYPSERRLLLPLALCTAIFFVGGALFGYFAVFPPAFKFFMSYNSEAVMAMPSLAEYFDFCIPLLIAFGLIFELPILAFFLARFGIITPAWLKKVRGYAYIGAFVVGAILTPPDVISQLCMAFPLLALYEISIWVARLSYRAKGSAPRSDAA